MSVVGQTRRVSQLCGMSGQGAISEMAVVGFRQHAFAHPEAARLRQASAQHYPQPIVLPDEQITHVLGLAVLAKILLFSTDPNQRHNCRRLIPQ